MNSKKFIDKEDAISPVIGVILMVAITVILAAIITAFVFGMLPPNKYESEPEGVTLKLTDDPQTNIVSMGEYRYKLEGDQYRTSVDILSKKCYVRFLSEETRTATIRLEACNSYPFT